MAAKEFKCKVCGYIHKGSAAPEKCPVCQAPASEFEMIKKGFDTNGNVYTMVYATVVVVIVAFLLAFISGALKSRQDDNVILDKKKQILSSLNVNVKECADPAAKYAECVKADIVVNASGDVIAENGGFDINVANENSKPLEERQLPLYICEIDGAKKYVVPMRGAGLWGPIWGYIALNDDKSTVFGVYFSHESETPGLGAEITQPKFQNQFRNQEDPKHIFRDGKFTSIEVVKPGQTAEDADYVDGISGGTMTSQGVNAMLKQGIGQYVEYFNKEK